MMQVMIVVIIAGGSGTRLWPLSTPDYPKHLLKIDGDQRSLLQHTYDRASQVAKSVYVVSDSSHIQHVKAQLKELSEDAFIVEPARRGTANCIITALVQIQKNHEDSEPVAFIHADHYIRDSAGFVNSLHVANQKTTDLDQIVLIGVEPDYPATGFGYIKKGELIDKNSLVYNVERFEEKPNFPIARTYSQSGDYLWNCGYFVGSVATFVQKMKTYAPNLYTNYQRLLSAESSQYQETYLELASDAIDYALIEKVEDLLVIPASFDWIDLGSFGDLHKAVGGDEQGNYIHGLIKVDEVENSLLQNFEDKPVAVIGLDNIVVINTPQGILVARKDLAQKVGDVSKQFKT